MMMLGLSQPTGYLMLHLSMRYLMDSLFTEDDLKYIA